MLPDVSGFDRLGETWTALGDRLRALGVTVSAAAPFARVCDRVLDPLAMPLRRYHLRRRDDALTRAMRLFMFRDSLTRSEARDALGDIPLERLIEGGLIVADGGSVASPFLLNVLGDLYVLCDDLTHGDEAVMGVSNTTSDLCRAVLSDRAIDRALDLGCGAGAAALSLARRTKVVVASDINPRAIVFTTVNTLLNRIDNVDARVGDMFVPVAGETFDVIVSQPPFVPHPEGAAAATFLYGGRRGDELPQRLLRELPPHLAPNGRAVVLVSWPVVEGDVIPARVRKAVGDDVSVLLLTAPPDNLDDWSAAHAFLEERSVDARFAKRAIAWREHFDRMKIEALRLSFNVIVNNGKAWAREVAILPLSAATVAEAHIDALIATSDLLASSDDEILEARLRMPPGAEIVERAGKTRVMFSNLLPPVEVSRGAVMLAQAAHNAPSVRDAIRELSARVGQGDLSAQMLGGIRQALAVDVLGVG